MRKLRALSVILSVLVMAITPLALASNPSTTNYQLNSFGFGSGGTANSTTPTYALEGITGEVSGQTESTTTYSTKPGYIETQQANVPTITLTNPSNYYDKLKFVIGQENNPTDATYALQISTTSDFSSNINYVKSDHTIGGTLTTADYQTYSSWGGASGTTIIGLSSSTTYYIRAKATQGKFTESGYGPSSSAATVGQQLSFCIYTGANCAAGGTNIAYGAILPGTVTDSPSNINIEFATNADNGGGVYVYSANGGLKSAHAGNYTITSATTDLSSASEGFGAKVTSASQGSGGPFVSLSPYNGSGNNVGILGTSINQILDSSSAPLSGGTAVVQLKALISNTTPAGSDYAETLTLIAAAAF